MKTICTLIAAFLFFILSWVICVGGFGLCVKTYMWTRTAVEEMRK